MAHSEMRIDNFGIGHFELKVEKTEKIMEITAKEQSNFAKNDVPKFFFFDFSNYKTNSDNCLR